MILSFSKFKSRDRKVLTLPTEPPGGPAGPSGPASPASPLGPGLPGSPCNTGHKKFRDHNIVLPFMHCRPIMMWGITFS